MKAKEYTLREKKHARTKFGLMNAFIKRLKKDCFEDVRIKEVCRDVEVAEGTFYNYFPEKIDVIGYFLLIRTLQITAQVRKEVPEGQNIARINATFDKIAQQFVNSNIIYQVISVLLIQKERPRLMKISGLEKKLAVPDEKGVEDVPSLLMDEWLMACLVAAQKNGELPAKVNIGDLLVSLMTILTGTLIATKFGDISRGYHFKRQLQALWQVSEVKG